MKKLICTILITVVCWGLNPVFPACTATQKTPTIAVVLLGSMEFQNLNYYDIATETLQKKFPADKYKIFVGDYPQQLFNRFSDKQGLSPGETPPEEKLIQFAWSHSFNEVLFLLLTAPSIKSNEITIQWENPEVTIIARALRVDAHSRKKLADVTSTQTVKTLTRNAAKNAAFKKCIDSLQSQL